MRPIRAVATIAILAAACTTNANDPTTTIDSGTSTTQDRGVATTTASTITTTTIPATTTSSAPRDPWSVEYPLEADTIDDLPSVLTDKLGAPEPDPDLSVGGPEDDLGRWVDEWLNWFSWVNANPVEGIDALEHGVVPASAFYEETVTALKARVDEGTRLLGYAFRPIDASATFDELFEDRELLRLVVEAEDTIPRYVVNDEGAVLTVHEPLGGETTLRLILRFRESEGEWILEILEVVG